MNDFKYCKLSTLHICQEEIWNFIYKTNIEISEKMVFKNDINILICILQSNHFYLKALKKQFSLCLKWIFFMTFILESFKHQQKSLQITSKEKISKIEFKTRKCNWWYIVIRNWHFIHIFCIKNPLFSNLNVILVTYDLCVSLTKCISVADVGTAFKSYILNIGFKVYR